MTNINYQYHKTLLGELIIASYKNKLVMCDWRHRDKRKRIDERLQNNLKSSFLLQDNELISNTRTQLDEYFKNQRDKFDIPYQLIGTDFQIIVWQALSKIPYGNTISYSAFAKNLAKANATRAVANANAANAISIIIPCHRIISKTGSLGGYAGGTSAKSVLLSIESKNISI